MLVKIMSQEEAQSAISYLNGLANADTLELPQVVKAVELLDRLHYSCWKQAHLAADPESVRQISRELNEARFKTAEQYGVCPWCYLPLYVCRCSRDLDGLTRDYEEDRGERYD